MSDSARIIGESVFNIAYLIGIWGIVAVMWSRWSSVKKSDRAPAALSLAAFAALALGDTGHVGFRVAAFAMGGLETRVSLFGTTTNLAALGSLATACTFTVFYVCFIFVWKTRYGKPFGPAVWAVLGLAVIRSLLMLHPDNAWSSLIPRQPWSIYRNLPLMLMQLITAGVILRDARVAADRPFTWIGGLILVSFVCYAPVIFFLHLVPSLGMLMIPKTLAYIVIAVICLAVFFRKKTASAG